MDILKPTEVLHAGAHAVKKLAARAINYSWGSEAVDEAEVRARIYQSMQHVEAPVQSEEELDGQLPLW